jgi:DNA adenine methylase
MSAELLVPPYPFFGAKPDPIVELVWRAVGDVPNYVEPFFGSGRITLGRPRPGKVETVNDLNGFICNFWRAMKADPETVAAACDRPVNETDLHSIHRWLMSQARVLAAKLEANPDYYDAKIAGWWAWGASCWIGAGWCTDDRTAEWKARPHLTAAETGKPGGGHGVFRLHRKRPDIAGHGGEGRPRPDGKGVHRRLPHLSRDNEGLPGGGQGVHKASMRQLPRVGGCDGSGVSYGAGINTRERRDRLIEWFQALQARLRHVRVCCGDFERVLSPAVTTGHGLTGVVLDPPYSKAARALGLYVGDGADAEGEVEVAVRARNWAIANGADPLLRVVYMGYEDGFTWPEGWTVHAWKAAGGYGNQAKDGRGRANAQRERIWFSPGCFPVVQQASLW